MNLEQELVALYDVYHKYTEESSPDQNIPPLFHAVKPVDIEISITSAGNFLQAECLPTPEARTVTIPVTEAFKARTSGCNPFPVVDSLKYIISPNNVYDIKLKKGFHQEYLDQLSGWYEYSGKSPYLGGVLNYVRSNRIVDDLLKADILALDEKNKIVKGPRASKFMKADITGYYIKFKVADLPDSDLENSEDLRESWIGFVNSTKKPDGMSGITGNQQYILDTHSPVLGNAKLFSANDKDNFVFRGRFPNPRAAGAIGLEDSAKFHTMLKWITANHCIHIGDFHILVWTGLPENAQPTDIMTGNIIDSSEEVFWDNDTEVDIRSKLYGSIALDGDEAAIDQDSVHILILQKVNDGRVAVLEYKKDNLSHYVDSITAWYQNTCWFHRYMVPGDKNAEEDYRKKNHLVSYFGTPPIKHIVSTLFGYEDKNGITIDWSDSFVTTQVKQMFDVVLHDRTVPDQFVSKAISRASSPQNYSYYCWTDVLDTACGILKNYFNHRNYEISTTLDRKLVERSYLYGRLLGIMDYVERSALQKKDGKGSEKKDKKTKKIPLTNALRFMSSFAQRPFNTWKTIYERTHMYLSQLSYADYIRAEKELEEVMLLFNEIDAFTDNSHLNGLYLLGFNLQRQEFYQSNQPERNREVISINRSLSDHNYLYGRLLAVMDYAERSALSNFKRDLGEEADSWETKKDAKVTLTNANRLQYDFSQHPFRVWKTLYERTNVYIPKLSASARVRVEKELEEILLLFRNADEYQADRPLNSLYLLGYYHQKSSFFQKKKVKETLAGPGLDRGLADRNYLYGRILGILENIERSAYLNHKNHYGQTADGKQDDNFQLPETNAMRFISSYSQHPLQTRGIIFSRTEAYARKLSCSLQEYYKKELDEVDKLIESIDAQNDNTPLNSLYILGLYHQRKSFYTKK